MKKGASQGAFFVSALSNHPLPLGGEEGPGDGSQFKKSALIAAGVSTKLDNVKGQNYIFIRKMKKKRR